MQGTTGRGSEAEPFDLGLFGRVPVGIAIARWRALLERSGLAAVLHSRQVHGARIARWEMPLPAGVHLSEGFDGHRSELPDLLLTVSVADCVPVFLVNEATRAIALLHAGWRGVAGGVVELGIEALSAPGAGPGALWLHSGPAICGLCYEVGPEVHRAIHPDRAVPAEASVIDLRAAISERALQAGIVAERITRSTHCTRCGDPAFFSHRAGDSGRQMGILGRRG